jgi:hypothetical protein
MVDSSGVFNPALHTTVQYISKIFFTTAVPDAMDMNESLLHSTIMNAAMDARIAVTDTYSFGFLPAGNKNRCLL